MRYLSPRREIEAALPTVVDMLRLRGEGDALSVLTQAEIELERTGYDNWDGGTAIWTAYLRVPPGVFLAVESDAQRIIDVIKGDLEHVLGAGVGFWVSLEIGVRRVVPGGTAVPTGLIGPDIRAAVLDEMRARQTVWYGALDDVRFLERLFDLSAMPSFDSRFENAEQDIWQHCINNDDWPLDWVYADERFNLYTLAQEKFLEFAAEVLHPIVRAEASEQTELATAFNGHLRRAGWELVEDIVIHGRPKYVPERRTHALGNATQRIKAVAASLSSEHLYEDLRRLERVGDSEPGEAIGLAKEIVESCCKLILDDRGISYPEGAEIPKLLQLLRNEIKIMPEGIAEDARAAREIRQVLSSLGNIAHALAPIRNAYGKGHGRGRNFKGLEPRHARLAIGAASTFVDFVLDRHRALRT